MKHRKFHATACYCSGLIEWCTWAKRTLLESVKRKGDALRPRCLTQPLTFPYAGCLPLLFLPLLLTSASKNRTHTHIHMRVYTRTDLFFFSLSLSHLYAQHIHKVQSRKKSVKRDWTPPFFFLHQDCATHSAWPELLQEGKSKYLHKDECQEHTYTQQYHNTCGSGKLTALRPASSVLHSSCFRRSAFFLLSPPHISTRLLKSFCLFILIASRGRH